MAVYSCWLWAKLQLLCPAVMREAVAGYAVIEQTSAALVVVHCVMEISSCTNICACSGSLTDVLQVHGECRNIDSRLG